MTVSLLETCNFVVEDHIDDAVHSPEVGDHLEGAAAEDVKTAEGGRHLLWQILGKRSENTVEIVSFRGIHQRTAGEVLV